MEKRNKEIPVFIPSLGAILIVAEDQKGEPLTADEVLEIRDDASCIMMSVADAKKLEETRGSDLDPENCWHDWQHLRKELGRTPELDPGPRLYQVSREDPAYQQTIRDAHATLDEFRRHLAMNGEPNLDAMVKKELVNDENNAFMWMNNVGRKGSDFVAELFEVPSGFPEYRKGQQLQVTESEVLDWSIHNDGVLLGGYSLRYHRSQLPEDERAAFDAYIGVTRYD